MPQKFRVTVEVIVDKSKQTKYDRLPAVIDTTYVRDQIESALDEICHSPVHVHIASVEELYPTERTENV